MNRLTFFALFFGLFGLTSCSHTTTTSTAITCTTTSSTSSSSSSSTCTDPTTNISVTISPATVSVNVVSPQQFSGFVSGGTNSVIVWKVNKVTGGDDTNGRIDSNGLYHAPATPPSTNPVSVTATSFEDQKLSAAAAVTVTPAPIVMITSPCTSPCSTPLTATSGPANTLTFSATETGGTTNTILWQVGPVGGIGVLGGNAILGTINANGVYSPPLTPPIGSTVVVTAVAQDFPTSNASATVMISGYSTSSLQGQFAFSMAGHILSGTSAGAFFRAGSFVAQVAADGTGELSGGLEDINDASGATAMPISFTGTYTVAPDGRGTLTFNDGKGPAPSNSSNFRFVLVNGTQLQIIGFDSTGTASGQANAQIVSTFTGPPLSALNGPYVFDFSGMHGSNTLSQIGEFNADGAGNVTEGSVDINDGGTASTFQVYGSKVTCIPPSPPPFSSYLISANGRGTLTLNMINPKTCVTGPNLILTFYVVSRGSAKFVGTDPVLQVAGNTSQQAPNAVFSVASLNGNYAFLLSGSAPGGAITTAGSFSPNGSGCLKTGSGVLDENVSGTPTQNVAFLPLASSDPECPGFSGKYTVDSKGRGTLTFQTSSRTYNLVFYIGPVSLVDNTATAAVFQEADSNITSDGTIAQQSPSSIQGSYAMDTSGLLGSALQVVSGQIAGKAAADGSGQVTSGAIDINTGGTLAAGQPVSGSYSAPATSGRATLTLNSTSPNYAAYVVSSTQIYLLGIETGQVAAGELLRQF